MKQELVKLIENRAYLYVASNRHTLDLKEEVELIERKKKLFERREAEIVKCHARAYVKKKHSDTELDYVVHYQFFIKQKDQFYLEEQCEQRRAQFEHHKLIRDTLIENEQNELQQGPLIRDGSDEIRIPFKYNRRLAVQYAEIWWNRYNPKYMRFENDCTNFISQCLHAGGAPMTGYPNRSKGWWMRNRHWSYSWAIANSLRWYLSGAKTGLRAREMPSAKDLLLGDIICYDFQGNGRYDHNTIVTAKDANGMPLVNAHTTNSRMRYWSYEDSTAYTPNIKYKFFRIVDN